MRRHRVAHGSFLISRVSVCRPSYLVPNTRNLMKTIRRSALIALLALGAASCGASSSVTAPDCENPAACSYQPGPNGYQPGPNG